MEEILKDWRANAERKRDANFQYIRSLKMKSEKKVDRIAKELHKEAFEKINCLKCGNCCKVSKPVLKDSDIANIAEFLGMTIDQIEDKYLELDEEKDWTFNKLPCPFLNQTDNSCQIYSARPKDCRKFPHTHKSGFSSRSHLHSWNTQICPATYYVVEQIKKRIR